MGEYQSGCPHCGAPDPWYLASTFSRGHCPFGQRFAVREAGYGTAWWCRAGAQEVADALNAMELEDGAMVRPETFRAILVLYGKRL